MYQSAPNPDEGRIAEVIARLQREEQRIVQERRTVYRTPFVRPVGLRVVGDKPTEYRGFAKNISPIGVGLILQDEFPAGTLARLSIHSLESHPVHLQVELRWCEPFGTGWFLTGWKLLAESKV